MLGLRCVGWFSRWPHWIGFPRDRSPRARRKPPFQRVEANGYHSLLNNSQGYCMSFVDCSSMIALPSLTIKSMCVPASLSPLTHTKKCPKCWLCIASVDKMHQAPKTDFLSKHVDRVVPRTLHVNVYGPVNFPWFDVPPPPPQTG